MNTLKQITTVVATTANVRLDADQLELLSSILHEYKDINRGDRKTVLGAMALEKHLVQQTNGAYQADTTYDIREEEPAGKTAHKGILAASIVKNFKEQYPHGTILHTEEICKITFRLSGNQWRLDSLTENKAYIIHTRQNIGTSIAYLDLPLPVLQKLHQLL